MSLETREEIALKLIHGKIKEFGGYGVKDHPYVIEYLRNHPQSEPHIKVEEVKKGKK